MESAGLEPLNIVAVLDFAGAGGGTNVADLAVGIAGNSYIPGFIKSAIGGLFGLDIGKIPVNEMGAVLDLQVSAARNLATAPSDIPRLRFTGAGGNALIKPIITGEDDGLVPAHSSCGASSPAARSPPRSPAAGAPR